MKRLYISTLILVLIASACQDIAEPLAPVSDGTMEFNLIAPGVKTKAFGDKFIASDEIGIYVTDYVNESTPMPLQVSGNRANNLALTYDGSAWIPENKVYWGTGKSDVYAYYPYMQEITDVNSQAFSVALDQSTKRTESSLGGYEASDFLWAKASGVAQKDGAVNLAMKHVLSKLTVKIVAGEDYVGSLPEDASVLLHSTVAAARVDLEKGAVVKDPYAGAESIQMNKIGLRKVDGADAVVYEAIVVPQMLETVVPLFEINSKSVSYLVEDSFNFRPGISYVYTITLNTSTNAIKVEIGCELEDWNSTGDGYEGGEGGSEGEDGDEGDDGVGYINLSADGTANCYIVSEAGSYKFKAVQGNMDATVGNVKTVEVLWESFGTDVTPNVGDLVANASYKDGYIRFSTPDVFNEGNAVVAAKNSAGTILWSWHLWFTDQPEIQFYSKEAGFMMDRNLGATSAEPGDMGAFGLLYQYGRKDPFLGISSNSTGVGAVSTGNWSYTSLSSDVSSNVFIDLMEKNPTTFYYHDGWDDSWADNLWQEQKTSTDPCPVGWRVPEGGENGFWDKAGVNNEHYQNDAIRHGTLIDLPYQGYAWFPHTGYADIHSDFSWVGYAANVRTTSKSGVIHISGHTYCTSRDKDEGISVRCCRDYDEELLPEFSQSSVDVASAINLSVGGTANCYVVSEAGVYCFPAVKGNSMEPVGEAEYTSVVWESFGTDQSISCGDLIEASRYENGKVYFKTADNFKEGNALLAVKDGKGKILWSWHIWMTDEPKGQEYYNNAGTMLDRNLGAISAVAGEPGMLGLVYQWGRKDPFIADLSSPEGAVYVQSTYFWPTITGTSDNAIEYTISHPTVIMYDRSCGDWIPNQSLGSVDNTRWQAEKTIYDPCPAGWRVPDGGEESVWKKAVGDNGFGTEGYNYANKFGDGDILYPNKGYLYGVYEYAYYWTLEPHPRKNENATINVLTLYGEYGWSDGYMSAYGNRVDRNLIRCQKE